MLEFGFSLSSILSLPRSASSVPCLSCLPPRVLSVRSLPGFPRVRARKPRVQGWRLSRPRWEPGVHSEPHPEGRGEFRGAGRTDVFTRGSPSWMNGASLLARMFRYPSHPASSPGRGTEGLCAVNRVSMQTATGPARGPARPPPRGPACASWGSGSLLSTPPNGA